MKPITKDQAADILQTLIPKDRKREARDQKAEALEMALRALRKDTATDCIERQAAIRAVGDYFEGWPTKEEGEAFKHISERIKALPSAKPEPIHGEWLESDIGELFCDRCGYAIPRGAEEDAESWNYCPSCGAQMMEEKE